MPLGQGALGLPQELQRGDGQAKLPLGDKIGGEFDERPPGLLPVILLGQIADGVQQGEGGVRRQGGGVFIVVQQGAQKAGDVLGPGVLEHRAHHQLQGIADVGALLGGGLVVGVDDEL